MRVNMTITTPGSMYVCMCIHVCMYMYLCVCICIYPYVCVYIFFLSLSPSLGLSLFLSHTFSPFLYPPLPTAHINTWNCHLFKFPNILKHILYTLPNHYNHSLGTLTTLCLTVCYCLYFLTILDHFVFPILVKCYLFVCLLVFPPALVCFCKLYHQ